MLISVEIQTKKHCVLKTIQKSALNVAKLMQHYPFPQLLFSINQQKEKQKKRLSSSNVNYAKFKYPARDKQNTQNQLRKYTPTRTHSHPTHTPDTHTHTLANRKNKYKIFKAFFLLLLNTSTAIARVMNKPTKRKKRFEQN